MFNGVKWVSLKCVMNVSERYMPTIPSTDSLYVLLSISLKCLFLCAKPYHIPVDSIFLLSALLLSLELPLFLLVVAGVHRFFKHLGATSEFEVPEG